MTEYGGRNEAATWPDADLTSKSPQGGNGEQDLLSLVNLHFLPRTMPGDTGDHRTTRSEPQINYDFATSAGPWRQARITSSGLVVQDSVLVS